MPVKTGRFPLPSSLFARMALILLSGLLAAQLTSLWLQWDERAAVVSQARGLHVADRIAEAVRVLEATEPTRREGALPALQGADMKLMLIGENQVSPTVPHGTIQNAVAARLGSEREIRSFGAGQGRGMGGGMGAGMGRMGAGSSAGQTPGSGQGMGRGMGGMGAGPMGWRTFDVRLNDGQWVRVSALRDAEAAPALPNDLLLQLALTLVAALAGVTIAVRLATKPLQRLAHAADTLGSDLDAPPLPEDGPAETALAAQAFNRMQTRIKRLIDERARALAAVSHDLRTPLTRLRLRAELVDDDTLRDQMGADLEAMATMIDGTLDYLRGLQESEPTRPIDINALLQSLAEDAKVLGRPVSVEGAAQKPYTGRLSALRRALQNLVDNAIKYGRCAHLHVDDDGQTLLIAVDDEGEGIAPEELEKVTEPYYRPDASRNRDTGGVGLGLSIVKDIALLHGGNLKLENRREGGLRAALVLPRGSHAA